MAKKMKRLLSVVLAICMLFSVTVFQAYAGGLPSHLIINQAYGRADKADAAISHSFVELYNPTDAPINLTGYSVQYAKNGSAWSKLDLTGSIISNGSYLIRCGSLDGLATRYVITAYDQSWGIDIDNDAFKIALVNNNTLLTVSNPSAADGVVDLLGAGSTDFYETKAISGISKQKSARRIAFSDTDDNSVDFEILDYRTSGINDGLLNSVKPRSLSDGAWGGDVEPPIPENEKLVFSKPAGLYTDSFDLTLSTGYSNAIIRYTTDGSDPTPSSTKYTAAINIKDRTSDANVLSAITNVVGSGHTYTAPRTNIFKATVIKARVFTEDGSALSDIATKSYIVNSSILTKYKLPIISVVTDRANFFDNTTGIYVNNNWSNKGADWERPVHFEMFESDGTIAVSQNMGIRINGGYTRGAAQKALRFYAKKGYDEKNPTVEYDLFEGKVKDTSGDIIKSFKRFILRGSGNDNSSTMMRDAMMQTLVSDLNADTQAYRQSVLLLNGEFWGIYNIRERYDDENFNTKYKAGGASNIGILEFPDGCNNVPDELDITDNAMVADYESYMEMWNWFNSTASLASDDNYKIAQKYIDIDNFIDYYVTNIYINNGDWPGNNNQIWRYRAATGSENAPYGLDGKWRWMLKDTDFGFGWSGGVTTNAVSRLLTTSGTNSFNAPWSTLFFRRLVTNETFKAKFINRFCDVMNTNFEPSFVTATIETMANGISTAMSEHISRWGKISNVNTWNNNVNAMKTFGNSRASNVQSHLRSAFSLSTITTLKLTTDPAKGYVRINATDITAKTKGVTDPSSWTGSYFGNTTQTITAIPLPGYEFSKFIVTDTATKAQTEYTTAAISVKIGTSGNTVAAEFKQAEADNSVKDIAFTNDVPTNTYLDGTINFSNYVKAEPATATGVVYNWSVENGTGSGSIASNGMFTPSSIGTVTVKVSATSDSGGSTPVKATVITILDYELTSAAFKDTSARQLKAGETYNLSANDILINGGVKVPTGNISYGWSSADPQIASVNSSGEVTAVKPGEVKITATVTAGGVSKSADVTFIVTYAQPDISIDKDFEIRLIKAPSADSNLCDPEFTIKSIAAASNVTLYVASYDINGKLLALSSSKVNIQKGETVGLSASINKSQDAAAYKYFIWNANTYAPLCEPGSAEPSPSVKYYDDLASNRPARASSTESGRTPGDALDGDDTGTRWAGSAGYSYPDWVEIDLGEVCELDKINILWFYNDAGRAYYYEVFVKTDAIANWVSDGNIGDKEKDFIGNGYTLAVDNSANETPRQTTDNLGKVKARYVAVRISGNTQGGAGNSSLFTINIPGWK